MKELLNQQIALELPYEGGKAFYDSPGIAEQFKNSYLMKAEEVILSSLRDELKDKPILDIGVGTGRTTPHLRAISKDYIGTDYSEKMISIAREKVSDATFLVCDAKNMTIFEDEQFAAVFFFSNGIDHADTSDRMLILKEINRVLKRGGVFVFLARNLEYVKHHLLAAWCGFSFSPNPISLIRDNSRRLKAFIASQFSRLRIRLNDKGYAVILHYVDFLDADGVGTVLPLYFINEDAQVRQLSEAGFWQTKALANDGAPLDDENRSRDYASYYVARKK